MAKGLRKRSLMEILEKTKDLDSDEQKEEALEDLKRRIAKEKETKKEKKRKFKVLDY